MSDAYLKLEDGTLFAGEPLGVTGVAEGEVVFATSMSGYQEILTDPSYHGQIVVMTFPMIGNYGLNADDMQSIRPQVAGFIVREASGYADHPQGQQLLSTYLAEHGVIGLAGVDTRSLVRHLRDLGTMQGVIVSGATRRPQQELAMENMMPMGDPRGARVVLLDYGVKHNIRRELVQAGAYVITKPGFSTTAEEILAENPDGVVLSNGPGDPKSYVTAQTEIQKLLGQVPLFGICLGHQLLALSLGADTQKLKFGHRGSNQPVLDYKTGRAFVTAQNHGYAVREESLIGLPLEVTERNLNDDTIEAFRHRYYPVIGVQYHPEAAPGPQDTRYQFTQFLRSIAPRRWERMVGGGK